MEWARLWVRAVRLYAISTSLTAVAFGGLYARWAGEAFSWVRWGVSVAAGVLLHAAANLWNDYFDFTGGVDGPGQCGSALLFTGELTAGRVFRGGCVCAALAAAGGLWLAWRTGWGLLWVGAAGVAGAMGYCAGAWSPKHHALGEAWVFLMMGLGMPLGGWMSQTGRFDAGVLWAAVPLGLMTALLLYNNNMRDIATDRAAGIRTLPMVLGERGAKAAGTAALAAVVGWTAWIARSGLVPMVAGWAAAVGAVGGGVWAWRIWQRGVTHAEELLLARVHLAFGVVLVLALC